MFAARMQIQIVYPRRALTMTMHNALSTASPRFQVLDIPSVQLGFPAGPSRMDAQLHLCLLSETHHEFNSPLTAASVALKAAFDLSTALPCGRPYWYS